MKTIEGRRQPCSALARAAIALAIGVAAAGAQASEDAALAAPAAAAKPNIVVMMMDDLDTSIWSQALLLGYLPNIQREMIAKGTTFNEAFVVLSTCCPSRSTFFTGQYPHNHGVVRNQGKHGGMEAFARHEASTIATRLQSAGYRTGLIGKYLNGYAMSPRNPDGTYIPPGWNHWQALFTMAQYDYHVSNNGSISSFGHRPEEYQTDVLAGFAGDFISAADVRPFFLVLTPSAPHYETGGGDEDSGNTLRTPPRYRDTPRMVPIPPESLASFNEADMRDKPAWMRSLPAVDRTPLRNGYNSRIAAIRALDDMFGTVVSALRAAGKEGDTLLIVTSDNGYQYGTHRRTAKVELYEESIRVPLVIRAPGQTAPRQTGEWALNTDLAPTLLDYAGLAGPPTLDGRSLRPPVEGFVPDEPRVTALVEFPGDGTKLANYQPFAMLRTKDRRLTGDASGSTTLVYAETYDKQGRRTDREFYDLLLDPLQLQSLHASKEPRRLRQREAMAERLQLIRNCAGDACRVLEN